jgi:hypothetical protein
LRLNAIILAVTLFAAAAPAHAAWKEYVYNDQQIAKEFPSKPAVTKGVYKTPLAVSAPSTTYSTSDEGVTLSMTVVDFRKRPGDGANLMNEAAWMATQGKGVTFTVDDFTLYDKGTNSVYGTIVTSNHPDGERDKAGIFFNKGRLYIIQAKVAADAADKDSPDVARFVGTVRFHMAGYGFDYTNGHDYPLGDNRPENRDLRVIPNYKLPDGYTPPPGAPPLNTTPALKTKSPTAKVAPKKS